jgi:predicted lipoprotein with Yx(FWY)xxD motif
VTSSTLSPRIKGRPSGPVGRLARGAAACALLLVGAVAVSGCGKTVSISDDGAKVSGSASSPASPSTSAAPPATTSATTTATTAARAGNAGLQVLGTTAAQAGKTGTGGTVTGTKPQPAPPKWVQLTAVTSAQLGTPHLVNINKATLYRFDKDTAQPPHSACDGSCATKWPPVTLQDNGSVFLSGVDSRQVGAIRRPDGRLQLTVGGWPVYRFSGDSKPGDLKGQGVDGTWFAVSPDGGKAL